jgi:hypothetical protein
MTAPSQDVLSVLDHLVYATPDLARTVQDLTRLLGITPSPGGAHPGRGTRNALLSLGPTSYLEIVGPDLDQPAHTAPRWFDIDSLSAPRLVTWAAKGTALDRLRAQALAGGVALGAVSSGSRQRPDGSVLAWQLTNPTPLVDDGIVPFFIDWGTSAHPAAQAAGGLALRALDAGHPRATAVKGALDALGLALDVRYAVAPSLVATIDGPCGPITLR